MKITKVRTFTMAMGPVADGPYRMVQVETDEGLSGLGEATMRGLAKPEMIGTALEVLGRFLIGKNPFQIERHWQDIYMGQMWRTGPEYLTALSALEIALWDIVGQALGAPVYNLLGGTCRERIRVYTHLWGGSVAEKVENALKLVELGYDAFKWDPFGHPRLYLSREAANDAVAQVKAVREAVGPDIDIGVEVHGRLNPTSAIEMGRRLEEYKPFFYEEPVPPENVDAMAKVARSVNIPIATGERLLTVWGYRELLEKQVADIIQPDLLHDGGILSTRKIAGMAEAYYVPLAPHNPKGPVCTAASVQLSACIPNFLILETMRHFRPEFPRPEWWDGLLTEPIQVEKGHIAVPDKPGLGIKLNEKTVAEYAEDVRVITA